MVARGELYAGTIRDVHKPRICKTFLILSRLSYVGFVFAEGLSIWEKTAKHSWREENKKIIELISNEPA